ncbi:MAG: crossover junction endodeoxyribonuclease RuvC [Candidatus Paceibacterota bacterium]
MVSFSSGKGGTKVLAIDPGYGRCGVAVVEKRVGGKEVLLYSDCIETSASSEFADRLNVVAQECRRLIVMHTPDCVALEKLYFSNNQKTAMRVAEVRGAILAIAGGAGVQVFEYTPGEIKSAAAGSGSADKKQVIKMLHALVKIDKVIRLDDEYDAIAIGITHLASARVHASRALRADAKKA